MKTAEVFERFDCWLLESKFQPISDWIHARYGLTNFRLAQICLLIGFAFSIRGYFIAPDRVSEIICLGVAISCALLVIICEPMERFAHRTIDAGYANELQDMRPRRYLIPGLVLVTILAFVGKLIGVPDLQSYFPGLMVTSMWATGIAYYFICCNLRPRRPLKAGNELAARKLGR